jgi:hypothetical protein
MLEGLPLAHSEFGDDSDSEGQDDLECHLPLLVPEELQDLGVNALRAGNYEAAVRYLNMAQLRATENLGKRLSGGGAVQVGSFSLPVCRQKYRLVGLHMCSHKDPGPPSPRTTTSS